MKKTLFTGMLSVKGLILTAFVVLTTAVVSFAQVTSSSIGGTIKDKKGETLIGASVIAVHVPSGTRYAAVTNESGQFFMPSVRVGGPYKVTVSYVGFKDQTQENISANLGTTANVNLSLSDDSQVLDAAVIIGQKNDVFSSNRTGAASTINSNQLAALPSLGARSLNDFTKYNPQGDGKSFSGQDSRLNNITIDGSVFNNGFGLGSSAVAGGRTGSTAISLDAIEEVQVNVAPFDVRQSGFVGAGVNAVTRSGTNEFSGSVYYTNRSQDLIGTKARNLPVTVANFNEKVIGARIGGPIIPNKLFFFANYESQRREDPATPYVATGSSNAGIPTRVLKSDMDAMSQYLLDKYGYVTGAYENFQFKTQSDKFLIRLDYNINDFNKMSVRYSNHQSKQDLPMSNSSSLGNGSRTLNSNSMAFENSGYVINDNTSSIVGELNSTFGSKASNTVIVSFNQQNEDRDYKATYSKNANGFFPTIDILNNGTTYMGLGFEPFTPNNQLNVFLPK